MKKVAKMAQTWLTNLLRIEYMVQGMVVVRGTVRKIFGKTPLDHSRLLSGPSIGQIGPRDDHGIGIDSIAGDLDVNPAAFVEDTKEGHGGGED